jgi:VIT1/CCC1 family predicted Fe2+/Mn2+ transporter
MLAHATSTEVLATWLVAAVGAATTVTAFVLGRISARRPAHRGVSAPAEGVTRH